MVVLEPQLHFYKTSVCV